jgi:hypothetical protein
LSLAFPTFFPKIAYYLYDLTEYNFIRGIKS